MTGLVEGVSREAQSFLDELVMLLDAEPAQVYRRLNFRDDSCLVSDKDRQTARIIANEAQARLAALPDVEHDYVCEEHQCLASWCGCLKDYLRTHCRQCEMALVSDGCNMVCPLCDDWPQP